ncbi:hypothetical protein NEOLEDRAFT_643412 [Neolentinus lepideus HHB14362 ss-1]|uniref:Uncharacterized protein n=1 Tax=Neolentinus lepideus HHB14362 ss-1 TaxID=1314782 RepID=A0A165QLB8_9AGAM|nr:hypothetical protein NEOLEDRAFT_643412 [Neolentinus lepideus HHB14362 ss-1]
MCSGKPPGSIFMFPWIVSCISYTLLLFAGRQTGPAPSFCLCLTQAILIYAAPVLSAFAGMALILQLLCNVCTLLYDDGRYLHIRTFWVLSSANRLSPVDVVASLASLPSISYVLCGDGRGV